MPDSPQLRYERIQEILQESILRDFPNPERNGCPGDDVLRRIAERRGPVRDDVWEHVTHCSPCYRQFLEHRAEVLRIQDRRVPVLRWVVVVAGVLIALAVTKFFLYDNRVGSVARRNQQVAGNNHLVSAVLNLESESEQRGSRQQSVGEIQRLPQKQLDLSIYLPFGSEPGEYEVRVLKQGADTSLIPTYKAAAEVRNGLTVLHLVMDLSSVSPGSYVLATRRPNLNWRYFRFVVG